MASAQEIGATCIQDKCLAYTQIRIIARQTSTAVFSVSNHQAPLLIPRHVPTLMVQVPMFYARETRPRGQISRQQRVQKRRAQPMMQAAARREQQTEVGRVRCGLPMNHGLAAAWETRTTIQRPTQKNAQHTMVAHGQAILHTIHAPAKLVPASPGNAQSTL